VAGAGSGSLRRGTTDRWSALEKVALAALPSLSTLRLRLERTGRPLTIGRYLVWSAVVAMIAAVVTVVAAGQPPVIGVLAGMACGVWLPHAWVGRKIVKRRNAFNARFADGIDLMVRGLRSGLPITECMSVVGKEMDGPCAEEFGRITDAVRFGQDLTAALNDAGRRMGNQEFDFFVVSLSVQRETGGNLAETLSNLSDILRKRRQMKLKIKALSSEARTSAYILGSLPFVLGGILFFVNPDYVMLLFTDPRGNAALYGGLTSIAVGAMVMAKMVKFEV